MVAQRSPLVAHVVPYLLPQPPTPASYPSLLPHAYSRLDSTLAHPTAYPTASILLCTPLPNSSCCSAMRVMIQRSVDELSLLERCVP